MDINGDMLLLARHLRGMTQEEACIAAGIAQGMLSKAENGLKPLPEDAFRRVADVYRLPLSFFTRVTDASVVSHFYYRRRISAPVKVVDAFVAKVRVMKMAFDSLFSAVELPDYDLGTYKTSEHSPSEIADMVRYNMGVRPGIMPNLTTLVENHGVVVWKMDFGTDKIDALSTKTDKGYRIIFLNSAMPNDRMRFSLAHELGHLVMHMDKVECGENDVENEADEFASQLLMPKSEISRMLCYLSMAKLAELKRRWRVSMRALVRRARDLGLMDDSRYRYMQINFSRSGYNRAEPVPLPEEVPSIVHNTVSLYKSELGYTDEDMARLSCLGITDFNVWFVQKNLKLIPLLRTR